MSCTRIWVYAAYLVALLISLLCAALVTDAQTVTVLYNFGTAAGDPNQPFYSGIIAQGPDGNLYSGGYGGGGSSNGGATFNITPAGALTTLFSFGGSDGTVPTGGLTLGTDGNFYGTAYSGGFGGAPYGTVFKMTPSGGFTLLHTFTDKADGALPVAPPVEGIDGNFYGTTCNLCNGPIAGGDGTIYKIIPKQLQSVQNKIAEEQSKRQTQLQVCIFQAESKFQGGAEGNGKKRRDGSYDIPMAVMAEMEKQKRDAIEECKVLYGKIN